MNWTVLFPFILAYILILWLETDALIEYVKLFRLDKFIPHFKTFVEKEKNLNYKEYLLRNSNNFFTRLIICPVCLVTWLSGLVYIPSYFFTGNPLLFLLWFPTAFISLILYKLYMKLSK